MLTFVVALLIVISVLVFVHELGHFVAAKSVGIDVPRFSVGMGPRVFGFHAWGTEWVISAVPLGGYVKLAGMEDEPFEGGPGDEGRVGPVPAQAEDEAVPEENTFDEQPLWARIWVISAGVIFNAIFAVLVYAALFLSFGERFNPDTRVAIVDREELPAALSSLSDVPHGSELVGIGDYRIETWDDVRDALARAPTGQITFRFSGLEPRVVRLPAGQTDRLRLLQNVQPFIQPVVGDVQEGSPADEAGLRPGDRIVGVDGEPIELFVHLLRAIEARPGEETRLTVVRDGETMTVVLTPAVDTRLDERTRNVAVGRIGVAPESPVEVRRLGPLGSLARGAERTWEETSTVARFVGQLVSGEESMRDLGGPIAIGQISADRMRAGLPELIALMGFISINLAVLNLLPIPILDGGHLLFLAIEGIRGRPLSVEQRVRLSHVGLFLVGGLMLWVITNDVLRFFGI